MDRPPHTTKPWSALGDWSRLYSAVLCSSGHESSVAKRSKRELGTLLLGLEAITSRLEAIVIPKRTLNIPIPDLSHA